MSKCIYICSREELSYSTGEGLYQICKKIGPDNIIPFEPKVRVTRHVAYGIVNPKIITLQEVGNSLLMGQIFGKNDRWYQPLEEFPDGSFTLYRDDENLCEIVSDPAASRTIWYYFDKNIFIASTSQRMMVMFLGRFEFDERVIPWMLSTGSLGPDFSWDKRIKRIPPDTSIILNKTQWFISKKSYPLEFNLVKRSDEQHEELLKETLKTTFQLLNIDYSQWVLPLSGGYDSRGILCLLNRTATNFHNLKTITWGLESSLTQKGNDAYIAKELADALNISHKYYHTDLSEEPIETIINRFIFAGEGRVDHLASYMDGFKIWKTLFEEGIQGTIRGDEGFGWNKVSSALSVRLNIGCCLCTDFANLKDYKKYGFASQTLPEQLQQLKGETLNVWRDRLYHEYRLPVVLAALTDLKLSYIEQINPLLSRKILQTVRQLPDHLRTQKALFKKIVRSLGPEVDFATNVAEASAEDILKDKEMVTLLKKELNSNDAKKLFPTEFLDFILKDIKTKNQASTAKSTSFSVKSSISSITPGFIKKAIRKVVLPNIDHNILAFRVLLIIKMNHILKDLSK
jgi:hypothetical protein